MTSRLIILALLGLAAWGLSCREKRPDADHRSSAPAAQPAPTVNETPDPVEAMREANDVVESEIGRAHV